MTTDTLPMLPDLPALPALRLRRFRPEPEAGDFEVMAELERAANEADAIPYYPDAETVRLELASSGTDPGLDVLVVERDGQPIAVAGTSRVVRDGVVVHDVWGHVRPDVRRRGLGGALLDANVRRARERAREHGDTEAQLGAFADEVQTGCLALLEREGFQAVRHFCTMRHPEVGAAPDLPLPTGLEIRPVTSDQHRRIFDAEEEAFGDHWGHRPASEADFTRTFTNPSVDTSLWVVAWDGDEVAGVVQSWIWAEENERLGVRRGWLEHISVRRPWRRRGLGRAITAAALRRLAEVGMDDAMLGVDTQNPNDALGLYEGLGFMVDQRGAAYRKPLEMTDEPTRRGRGD